MKFSWITRSLQASAVASAMLLVFPASAQTPAPEMPAAAAAPAAQPAAATPRMQHRAHRAEKRAQHHRMQRQHHRARNGEPANANSLAHDMGDNRADYRQNAMARCSVFKTQEDHKACIERMRQRPEGSVQGGGLLWEYSYQVPADGS